LLADRSRQNFEALKGEIRQKLPDLPAKVEDRLTAATSHDAVVRVFDEALSGGVSHACR
jgi:hypothetical protein